MAKTTKPSNRRKYNRRLIAVMALLGTMASIVDGLIDTVPGFMNQQEVRIEA